MGDLSENFNRSEFCCECGCGFDTVDAELVRVVEATRKAFFDRPVTINSGCRCQKHNQEIGGALRSQHVAGKAADIVVHGVSADEVANYLEETYPGKYGIGRYNGRTHIDVRPDPARWDKRG